MDAIEQFKGAMRTHGLNPPEIIEPGKLHRFATNGKRHNDAGWCKLFADGGGGVFGDFRSGLSETWQAQRENPFTPAEREAFRQRCQTERRAREAEEASRHAEAREKAAAIWKAATPAGSDHPYLARKQVSPVESLRDIEASEAARILDYAPKCRDEPLAGRLLVVPIKVAGELSTVEFIDEAGRKSALYGGVKTGGYWAAQRLLRGTGTGLTLLLAEGMATALSAREATGHRVIVALSSSNLLAVAGVMRRRFPAAVLVILADLIKTTGEPDPHAIEAARAIGGLLAVPDFGENRPAGATDFNDLALRRGREAVQSAIASATSPARDESQPGAEDLPVVNCESRVLLVRGDALRVEPIRWLWEGWLARGKLHMLAGAPGTGKSTIALTLAAVVTAGGRWPDSTKCTPGHVLVWSDEDDPADTLLPRFLAADGDPRRVHFVTGSVDRDGARQFDPATDIPALLAAAREIPECALVLVDPVVTVVSGDSHKNTEVRRALRPLAAFASELDAAVLGISHFTKGTAGRDPVERVTGSVAFGALPRVVMAAARVREADTERRIFCRAKSNIGPDTGGWDYRLDLVAVPGTPGVTAVRTRWGEAQEGSARDLLAEAESPSDSDGPSILEDAKAFLADLLGDGPIPANRIYANARGAGYSERTIRRAQQALGVESQKEGMKGPWLWRLPPKAATKAEDGHTTSLGAFGNLGRLRTACGREPPDLVEGEL